MLNQMFTDPMFYFAIAVFIVVMLYFWSLQKKQEKEELLERIRKLEEKEH